MLVIETDPNGIAPHTPGAKLDAGKLPVTQGAIQYFPLALLEVARLSLLGAEKYSWSGYLSVSDGYNRYSNALGRHLLREAVEVYDADTKIEHDIAVAWNALARLEVRLRGSGPEPSPDAETRQ
jgi:hypothetical protein